MYLRDSVSIPPKSSFESSWSGKEVILVMKAVWVSLFLSSSDPFWRQNCVSFSLVHVWSGVCVFESCEEGRSLRVAEDKAFWGFRLLAFCYLIIFSQEFDDSSPWCWRRWSFLRGTWNPLYGTSKALVLDWNEGEYRIAKGHLAGEVSCSGIVGTHLKTIKTQGSLVSPWTLFDTFPSLESRMYVISNFACTNVPSTFRNER